MVVKGLLDCLLLSFNVRSLRNICSRKRLTIYCSSAAEKRSLRRITVAYVVLGVTYLSAILVVFCKCMPLQKQWQIHPDPGSKSHISSQFGTPSNVHIDLCYSGNSTFQMAFVMSINTLTQMYIMIIPIPVCSDDEPSNYQYFQPRLTQFRQFLVRRLSYHIENSSI